MLFLFYIISIITHDHDGDHECRHDCCQECLDVRTVFFDQMIGVPTMAYFALMDSPIGQIFVGGSDAGVHIIKFVDQRESDALLAAEVEAASGEKAIVNGTGSAELIYQLRQYFRHQRDKFDLVLAPRGTEFQLRVWQALREIPAGETMSYGAIAKVIGKPLAFRAVGAANHRNPISIVVPCHRVIGADGTPTGYAGGLYRKIWLLKHELRATQPPLDDH